MAVTLKGQTAVYEGTSTDTKPTDADNNSIFKELDTGIRYYYDGTDWNEIPSSGGGGGGTGTDNYNELNNKPSINGTTLSGNKSLDNLGIQAKLTFDSAPTEDSENPVKSGGVYSALAGKQDTISDLSTIRSGAAAGASAVQPAAMKAALAQKQDTLSSAQLEAVNSGITAADVEQITTNKNNILSLTQYGGGINKFQVTATTTTVNGITFTVNADKTITATGSIADSSKNAIFTIGTYTAVSGDVLSEGFTEASRNAYVYARGGSTSLTTVPYREIAAGDIGVQREYACAITADTVGQVNITFKPMICNSDIYAKSGVYQPYAMSNAELTPTTSTIEYTVTAAETWEKTSLSIPVAGKKAVYFVGNVMYSNAEPLGVGIGKGNTFSGTSIMAITEESAGTMQGALSCNGIYYNNSPSSQTLDLWVKYKTAQRNMITLMYRQL